jgi:uncharacterized repeat protein (TIGR01451 family)
MANWVKICGSDQEPFETVGQDCSGAPVATMITPGQGGYAVQPEGHAYNVKICTPTGQADREMVVMCTPTGGKVIVQNVTPQEAPLGTAPVFEAWNFDSTPWAGDVTTLVDCGAEKVDIAPAAFFCSAGQEVTRTSIWDISVQPAVLLGNIWQDVFGAIIAQPAAATLYSGQCRQATYVERAICANTTSGEIWNMVERTVTQADGTVSVRYFDADTSPMADVTEAYLSIRHGGECDCCNDVVPVPVTGLRLFKAINSSQYSSVQVGQPAVYQIVVNNDGPSAADGATLVDTHPAEFIYDSYSVSYSGGAAGLTGVFPNFVIGTMPSGGQVELLITGHYDVIGETVNTATVTPATGSVNNPPTGLSSSATTAVSGVPASVTLTKTAPAVQDINQLVQYVITMSNAGPGQANGVGFSDQLPAEFTPSSFAWSYTGGASGGSQVSATYFAVATMPSGSTATLTIAGVFNTAAGIVENTVVGIPPANNPAVGFTGSGTDTATSCARGWLPYHELLIPISTIMGVYSTGSGVNNLGFVDYATGAVTFVANIPGANLNALGLDKSSNNAVFLDRATGRIYTAYSPYYVVAQPSVLGAGPIAAANAIMGALDSAQQWWVGGITNNTGTTAQINIGVVDPQTGVQTAVPSLTATLSTGSNGFDFDFAPNDDLYALTGLNIYVATKSSNYSGWTNVGTLTGIAATGGSVAYDQGTLRGTSATGQIWAYDISTGVTSVTSNMPAGFTMADMSGATDPVCKRFFLNNCDGKFYELNKVVEYVPYGTAIAGDCA